MYQCKPLLLLELLLLFSLGFVAVAAASFSVKGSIQPSQALPDVSHLSPLTTLTLSRSDSNSESRTAHVLADNTFRFRNVSSGSYLLDVHCRTHAFAPMRVDVKADGSVEVFGTFRGNEWTNLGERKAYPIELRAAQASEFYVSREGFNPMKMLSNPMILIAIVSVGGLLLVPKIVDNMDPEMKAEFEKTQRESRLTNPAQANPLQNFDMASYLAGRSSPSVGGSSNDQNTKHRK